MVAVGVVMVLTILVTAALAYTSSDSRDASRSSATQKAYAAAEAGVNNALSVVQLAKSNTSGVPAQPASANCSGCTVTTLPGGATVTWGANYNATTKVWTVKAIGSVPNPTGADAAAITRTLTQTARITPPPYNFVALNTSCDNHTLLVQTGGQLTVTNAMYIDSCSSGDAFDIFGAGGNISDPAGIKVVGGWETHNGSTVTTSGTLCPLSTDSSTQPQPAGCPTTVQPILPDPLAGKVSPPTLSATGACTSTGQTTSAYTPAVQESGAVTASSGSQPLTIKFGPGTNPVHVGDVILIDSEQMLVTAAPATVSPVVLTVTRGYNSTTITTHADKAPVVKVSTVTFGTPANPSPCLYTSGSVTLNPGTYYGGICIGSASTANCDGANCTTTAATTAYSPTVQESGATTASTGSQPLTVKFGAGTDPIQVGDVILIDSEQMLVTAAPATVSPVTLTVTRGYNSTTVTTHADKAPVTKVMPLSHVTATLNPGTYIMAGGGFRVCGSSTLSAPNVMIYNTQDPSQSTGFGALDQLELNTTGTVSLGPPASGIYQGLTFYQDSSLALDTVDSCNSRNNTTAPTQTQINEYDIALMSAAPVTTPTSNASGSLGSISGSIYAPANRADFVDALSGVANLAVLSSCILINGGNSTFNYDPAGLFGTGWDLGPQAG